MIVCDKIHLLARCEQRGYTLDEVMPCVVAQDGDEWTIDVDHPAYPRVPKPGFVPTQLDLTAPSRGPGTELQDLLGRFGITSSGDCKCRSRSALMDAWGCEECSKPERIDEIVGWLREQAAERGLPFLDAVGRVLVSRAIANARRKEAAANAKRPPHKD